MPRPPISEKVHSERRYQMLGMAKRLFILKGYDNTTVDDIINELKFNKSTFYHHFKTKLDILEAVVDAILADLETTIQAFCHHSDGASELAAHDKMNAWFQLYYDTTRATRNIWLSYYRDNNTRLHRRLMIKSIDVFAPLMADILREGIESNQFNNVPPLETAGAILYLFDFFVTKLNDVNGPQEIEHLYGALWRILSCMLGATFDIAR